MEDDAPVIYGLESQARAITAQVSETDVIRFIVGTQSLRLDNQVHLIEFDDENSLINKTVYTHRDGEIWDVAASPSHKNIIATSYNKSSENNCEMFGAIWQIPYDESTSSTAEDNVSSPGSASLELLCRLESKGKDVKCIQWQPSDEQARVISVVDNKIHLWDLAESSTSAKLVGSCSLDVKGQPKFTTGRWNPHQNCSQFGTVNDTCIRGWDLRSMQQAYFIENAHCQLIRDIDFNPNKQYYLASCGDDCYTKFWDIRNTSRSVVSVCNHSHWVWCVRYNHFHDQLILTSSSDSRVVLSNMISISSEPFGHLADEEEECDEIDVDNEQSKMPKKLRDDGVIAVYEEHEESVYATEWSTADPWTFASLSYDGRLVINRVPRSEKYKILL